MSKHRAQLTGKGLPVAFAISSVPTAGEVAGGSKVFTFPFKVTLIAVLVAPTATPGIAKAWDGAAVVARNTVTIDNAGNVDWAATDTVTVLVVEAAS